MIAMNVQVQQAGDASLFPDEIGAMANSDLVREKRLSRYGRNL